MALIVWWFGFTTTYLISSSYRH